MTPKRIVVSVLWLALLAATIAELACGTPPLYLVGSFLGLAAPLIVRLTSL